VALQYCPNGECVNFLCEVDTSKSRSVMCAWELVQVKKQTDAEREPQSSQKNEAA